MRRAMMDPDFLKKRDKGDRYVLTVDDASRLSNVSIIDFLIDTNTNEKVTNKPVTIIPPDVSPISIVTSADLYRLKKYAVERVRSISSIRPEITADEVKCPSCNFTIKNPAPRYLLPPCPRCAIHPGRWVVVKQGVVDAASGYLTMCDDDRGIQTTKFFIDSWNLSLNQNFMNLVDASISGNPVTIDAVPALNYKGVDDVEFVLWIVAVYPVKDRKSRVETGRSMEFIVDNEPSGEKETVHAIFFRNLEFMRLYMGFHDYHLQTGFPDMIIKMNEGDKKIVEFEYDSRNFDAHGHPASITDYIICWKDGRKKDDGPHVIELQRLVNKKITIATDHDI